MQSASRLHITANLECLRWVVTPRMPTAPLQLRYIRVQVLHLLRCFTHMPRRSGAFKARTNEKKVKMKGKWRWDDGENEMTNYLASTRDGERKRGKEKRENTNTNTPSPEWANPERAREKKKRTDDGPNTDQRRGGRRKRLTQPTRREPNLPRDAKDPNLT